MAQVGANGIGRWSVGEVLLVGFLAFSLLVAVTGRARSLHRDLQERRQDRTIGQLRVVGQALDAFGRDHGSFPKSPEGTVAGLSASLVPTYADELPVEDAWGHPIRYAVSVSERPGLSPKWSYTIESYGRDGDDSGPPSGAVPRFEDDLSYSDGFFVAYPDRNYGR